MHKEYDHPPGRAADEMMYSTNDDDRNEGRGGGVEKG